MPNVVRQGDINQPGGAAIGNFANSVLCNGLPVAKIGTLIAPHFNCGSPGGSPHCSATIITGNPTVLVEGIPIAIIGSLNSCGHIMVTGSGDVQA